MHTHTNMVVDYYKDMKKSDLARVAELSSYTIQKLNRNENVTVETLAKICLALNCTVDDIMEVIGGNE